jgi:predicted proteasome-type protease
LPIDILSIIKQINEERNKLHFISINEFQFGKPTIDKYSKVIDFANTTIKKCILDLDSNMKQMIEEAQKQ